MADRLVLSASSIEAYLRCPHAYLLEHVYRQPKTMSLPLVIGTAVHAGVEEWLHRKAWDADAAVVAQDALGSSFSEQAALIPDLTYEDRSAAESDAALMLTTYIRTKRDFEPALIEEPFIIRLGDDLYVSGVLDAADEDIHDLKTTAGKSIDGRKAPTFDPARYDLQLNIYSIGYESIVGEKPKRLILDVITRLGRYREYVREPRHDEALDAIGIVRDGIAREEFPPTGALQGICRFCPMQGICRHAAL